MVVAVALPLVASIGGIWRAAEEDPTHMERCKRQELGKKQEGDFFVGRSVAVGRYAVVASNARECCRDLEVPRDTDEALANRREIDQPQAETVAVTDASSFPFRPKPPDAVAKTIPCHRAPRA